MVHMARAVKKKVGMAEISASMRQLYPGRKISVRRIKAAQNMAAAYNHRVQKDMQTGGSNWE